MICNLMTQPGETDGLSASKHLEIIRDHMPQVRFDYIIVNDQVISERQATLYQVEGAIQIGVDGSISESVIEEQRSFMVNSWTKETWFDTIH